MDQLLEVSAFSARVLIGLVFVLAGVSKARAPAAFAGSLGQYRILPSRFRPAIVGILPALEVFLGATLIAGVTALPATAMAIALLAVFTIAHLTASKQDASNCGCFGSFGTLNVKSVIRRNVVLMLIAAIGLTVAAPAYSLAAATGLAVSIAVVAAASAMLLVVARGAPVVAPTPREPATDAMGRRSFLGKVAMLGVGAAAVAAVSALKGTSSAEACSGCGSCGYQYIWIACTGACCAAFWVAPFDYCAPSCYQCGSWNTQVYCGYSQCCS